MRKDPRLKSRGLFLYLLLKVTVPDPAGAIRAKSSSTPENAEFGGAVIRRRFAEIVAHRRRADNTIILDPRRGYLYQPLKNAGAGKLQPESNYTVF